MRGRTKAGLWTLCAWASIAVQPALAEIVTYTPEPAMDVKIYTSIEMRSTGATAHLYVDRTNGDLALDLDTKWLDDRPAGLVADTIAKVMWKVPVGTVDPPETSAGSLERFGTKWTIPPGTLGKFVLHAEVYDAGAFGEGSRDTSEGHPIVLSEEVRIGDQHFEPGPPIEAWLVPSATRLKPGETVILRVTDSSLNAPPKDLDTEYWSGVSFGNVTNTYLHCDWDVVDLTGQEAGTLVAFNRQVVDLNGQPFLPSGAIPDETVALWTAPAIAGTYYVILEVTDHYPGEDPSLHFRLPLVVGSGLPYVCRLTEAFAVERVRAFCAAIGAPVGPEVYGMARFPEAMGSLMAADVSRPKWEVRLGDHIRALVVDTDATIARFTDDRERLVSSADGAHGVSSVSREAAYEKMRRVLAASGVREELLLTEAVRESPNDESDPGRRSWNFLWDRSYKRIPYWEQKAGLYIQESTGIVRHFGVRFPGGRPVSSAQFFTQEHAQLRAGEVLSARGITELTWRRTRKMVVRPNTQWEANGTDEPLPGPPRVAWVVEYAGGRICEVWVDTETGKVIGGVEITFC